MYVDDLIDGLIRLMASNYSRPVNLGNPDEYRISELAEKIRNLIGSQNHIVNVNSVEDDPRRRKPDITTAEKNLNWTPKMNLIDGLYKTVEYFKKKLSDKNNGQQGGEFLHANFYRDFNNVNNNELGSKDEL